MFLDLLFPVAIFVKHYNWNMSKTPKAAYLLTLQEMLILLDPEGIKSRSMFTFSIGFPGVVGSGETDDKISENQG